MDLGHLALPRKKDAVPEGEIKPRMGGGRGEQRRESSAKIKGRE